MAEKTIRLKYLGKGTKIVPIPVPLISLSQQVGEVVCDPYGVFPLHDGLRLLKIAPTLFEIAKTKRRWGTLEKAGDDESVYILSSKARVHYQKTVRKVFAKNRGSVTQSHAQEPDTPSPAESEGEKERHYG